MAKIRMKWTPLKADYPNSKKVNRLSFKAETLFIRLLASCDDHSNFDGEPTLLACKLYAERLRNGSIDMGDLVQMRNELVTNSLAILYESEGETYLHLPNNHKCLRSDIKKDIRYPDYTEVSVDKELTENDTDALRNCNENGSSNTTPIPITESDTTTIAEEVGDCKKISLKDKLALDLKLSKERKLFVETLNKILPPGTPGETMTFKNITDHLVGLVEAGSWNYSLFDEALAWAKHARHSNSVNKKGLFVAKVKKETGFKGQGKLLC